MQIRVIREKTSQWMIHICVHEVCCFKEETERCFRNICLVLENTYQHFCLSTTKILSLFFSLNNIQDDNACSSHFHINTSFHHSLLCFSLVSLFFSLLFVFFLSLSLSSSSSLTSPLLSLLLFLFSLPSSSHPLLSSAVLSLHLVSCGLSGVHLTFRWVTCLFTRDVPTDVSTRWWDWWMGLLAVERRTYADMEWMMMMMREREYDVYMYIHVCD